MRKEFVAIAVVYLVGFSSFFAQWHTDFTRPLKGLQVIAVIVCVALCAYSLKVATNKKAVMAALPAIVLAGWGGFKFLIFMAAMIIPVLIGGHSP